MYLLHVLEIYCFLAPPLGPSFRRFSEFRKPAHNFLFFAVGTGYLGHALQTFFALWWNDGQVLSGSAVSGIRHRRHCCQLNLHSCTMRNVVGAQTLAKISFVYGCVRRRHRCRSDTPESQVTIKIKYPRAWWTSTTSLNTFQESRIIFTNCG